MFRKWFEQIAGSAKSQHRRQSRSVSRQRNAQRIFGIEQLEERLVLSFSPAQISHAYGFDDVYFPSSQGGFVKGDGSGQTIAIVIPYQQPNLVADLHAFDQAYGLPDPQITICNQSGSTDPSTLPALATGNWGLEASLDVEWAHAMAPGAGILVVEASFASNANLLSGVNTAAQCRYRQSVAVAECFRGLDELGWSRTFRATRFSAPFSTPVGKTGVTFVGATGDTGARGAISGRRPERVGRRRQHIDLGCSGQLLQRDGMEWQQRRVRRQPRGGVSTRDTAVWAVQHQRGAHDPRCVVQCRHVRQHLRLVRRRGLDLGGRHERRHPLLGRAGGDRRSRVEPYRCGPLDRHADPDRPVCHLWQRQLPVRLPRHHVGQQRSYSAGPGYDLVTGLGSPRADVIANLLAGDSLTPTTLSPSGTISSATPTFQWSAVAGATGYYLTLVDTTSGQTILSNLSVATNSYTPTTPLTSGDSYQWQVQALDSFGTMGASSGATTFIVNATGSVNHPPVGTSKTVTTNEDTAYTFSVADFGFSDPNDNPANSLLAVKITTLPTAGTLTDNGVAVTAGQLCFGCRHQ